MAQISRDTRIKIESALLSYFNTYGRETYIMPSFKQKAYAFGFIIGINKDGKTDTIIFSNQTKTLDSLVSFETISKNVKKITELNTNKNTLLVGLVLVRRDWDSAIANFHDPFMRRQHQEKQGFDEYFLEMIPFIPPKLNSRKTLLLPTFGLIQMPSIR